jgi:hypothetical protein
LLDGNNRAELGYYEFNVYLCAETAVSKEKLVSTLKGIQDKGDPIFLI